MVREDVGRLPVVARDAPEAVVGFITRGDLLAAHRTRLAATHEAAPGMFPSRRSRGASGR
jgi:hypothetical protein